MLLKRALHLLLLSAVATAAAQPEKIDAELQRASDYTETNPDSALIVTSEIRRMSGLTDAQRVEIERTEGNAQFNLGKSEEALGHFREAARISRQNGDSLLLADVLSDLGVIYRVGQKPDSALICYNEALAIMQRNNAPARDQAMLLTSMAILYSNLRRHSDAVPFVRRAMAKAEESGEMDAIMYAGSQGGSALFQGGFKDEALDIARTTMAIAEREKSELYMLKAYLTMFQMHYLSGRQDSALAYYEKGRPLVDKMPENSLEALAFLECSGLILSEMGHYKESLGTLYKILSIDKSGAIPAENLWLNIARNYRALGDMKHMADAYEKSVQLSDSTRRSAIDAQLSEFNVKYETMEKELEITRLESERTRQRMIAVIIIAAALLLVGALVAYIIVRRRRELTEKLRANLQGIEQERERLARDLHDGVCNDLYGVSLLMQSGAVSTAETTDEINRIRSEVRHISHELMPPRFKDSNLDGLLETYALTSDGFLTYESEGECGLEQEISYQLYRIIQETIGNIRSHTDATSAAISANYDGPKARITIRYTGKAHNDTHRTNDGIGLTTIERRCELIHATLLTAENGEELTVTIKL